MAKVVERVVGVVDEVPADQVVGMRGVAILSVVRVGPTAETRVGAVGIENHRGEDVAGIDHAVAVDVGDLPRPLVDRVVQIAPGDVTVMVDIDQVLHPAGGDLRLVDPDVLINVGRVVIDPAVDIGNGHGRGRAGRGIPGGGGLDAVGSVQTPEIARREIRIVRDRRRMLDLLRLDERDPRIRRRRC